MIHLTTDQGEQVLRALVARRVFLTELIDENRVGAPVSMVLGWRSMRQLCQKTIDQIVKTYPDATHAYYDGAMDINPLDPDFY